MRGGWVITGTSFFPLQVLVSSIKKSRKRKLSSFTTKNIVNFCKGCDVHIFFVEEIMAKMCHL